MCGGVPGNGAKTETAAPVKAASLLLVALVLMRRSPGGTQSAPQREVMRPEVISILSAQLQTWPINAAPKCGRNSERGL